MKVALIVDPLWLMQELPTLRRLAVGLVDEQVRVVRVVPDWWLHSEDNLPMTGQEVGYRGSAWRWLRDRNLRAVERQLREMEVELVHVLDGSLQKAGRALGESLGVPTVCSVWSGDEVGALPSPNDGQTPIAYAAATAPLAERCRTELGGSATVRIVPPGVYSHATDWVRPPLSRPEESLCCLVVGNGQVDSYYQALLEGMAQVRDQVGQALYFFYTVASDQHGLWRLAEKLGLSEQVSWVPFEPGSRDLLVQADVVIQPQPTGRVRTLVLEAMAAGRPVLSTTDPLLDYLIEGRTAQLLPSPTADQWAGVLRDLVTEPERWVQLGQRARDYVRSNHPASAFVRRCIELYEQMLVPRPLPFQNHKAS